MDRKKILIGDKELGDIKDLRKALITAGYEVRMVDNGADALAQLDSFKPDLVMVDVRLPNIDGPHLLQELRTSPASQCLPVIMMGNLKTMEERVSTMKLPIDDYLQKPVDIEEVLARVELLLREAESATTSPNRGVRGFSGTLSEMNLVDLLQTLEAGKKTGVLRLRKNGKEGVVYVSEGQVIDAVLDRLDARQALLRMFTWGDGYFHVEMKTHDRPRMLTVSNRDLISEGMTRQYRWNQIASQLPPLHAVVHGCSGPENAILSEEEQEMVGLLNGCKRLIDLVEESQFDDLRALAVLKSLYERGFLEAAPSEAASANGDYLEKLRQRQSNGSLSVDRMTEIFLSLLQRPGESPKVPHERRRQNRRSCDDRRRHERLKPRIYLNKSELILIREKLSH